MQGVQINDLGGFTGFKNFFHFIGAVYVFGIVKYLLQKFAQFESFPISIEEFANISTEQAVANNICSFIMLIGAKNSQLNAFTQKNAALWLGAALPEITHSLKTGIFADDDDAFVGRVTKNLTQLGGQVKIKTVFL